MGFLSDMAFAIRRTAQEVKAVDKDKLVKMSKTEVNELASTISLKIIRELEERDDNTPN